MERNNKDMKLTLSIEQTKNILALQEILHITLVDAEITWSGFDSQTPVGRIKSVSMGETEYVVVSGGIVVMKNKYPVEFNDMPEVVDQPCQMSMKETAPQGLVDFLDILEGMTNMPDGMDYLTDGKFEELPQIIKNIVITANAELISPDGRPNMNRARELSSAGYQVSPGEVDSFGWLSAVIDTRKGRIVFG